MALSLCAASVDNTGGLACDKSKGVPRKVFIWNGELDTADYTSAQAAFDNLVAHSKLGKSAGNKLFAFGEVQNVERNSEANTTGTLNLGFTTIIREGRPAYTVKVFAGADELKRLRTFNNQTVRILEYDANDVIWGTKIGTKFKGFQAKLFFAGGEVATGQNVEEGVVDAQISILSNSEYKDNPKYIAVPSGNSIDDIAPLIDVPMTYVSQASNVFQIDIKIPGTNLIEDYNIYDDYGTTIATLDANFSAGTGTNYGTSLAITSVTVNAGAKRLVVTFDSTAFSALSSSTAIQLTPPTPAQLDAAGVSGIELLPVIVTKA